MQKFSKRDVAMIIELVQCQGDRFAEILGNDLTMDTMAELAIKVFNGAVDVFEADLSYSYFTEVCENNTAIDNILWEYGHDKR